MDLDALVKKLRDNEARVHLWMVGLVALCVVVVLGGYSVSQILSRAGRPAFSLDDSFIHLQYGRQLARGEWFAYSPGDGYTSGATSFFWPMLTVPFFWVGLKGFQLIWVVWFFGGLFHWLAVLEAYRAGQRLGSSSTGWIAGGLMAIFPANIWFAYSGMETIALSWALLAALRLSLDALAGRAKPRLLLAVALVAPLIRPEGALATACAAMTLSFLAASAWRRRRRAAAGRLSGLAALSLLGPAIIPTSHAAFAGHRASSTSMVKWLLLDPYMSPAMIRQSIEANLRLMFSDLLNGGRYTAEFLPEGSLWCLVFALGVGTIAAWRRKKLASWGMVVVLGLSVVATTTYSTMLWNRVRYIWPFAGGWFLIIAFAITETGSWLGRRNGWLSFFTPLVGATAVALLASNLNWAITDLATSCRAIDRQQVQLGLWVDEQLAREVRVGVNDTGAIAYFGKRPTFDIVGLTTEGEAAHWARGRGARFEHYERLPPEKLPTHFVVYPGWMGIPELLGAELTRATVRDQSILGGATKVAYKADWGCLHTGASPPIVGEILAELDVGDHESEQALGYRTGTLGSGYCVVKTTLVPMAAGVAERVCEGGRTQRAEDRFVVSAMPSSTLWIRAQSSHPLRVLVGGDDARIAKVRGSRLDEWSHFAVEFPEVKGAPVEVVVMSTEPVRFASFHYWWVRP